MSDNKCTGCVWNERVRCGKDFCSLPKCVKKEPKQPKKKEGG